jgi:2-methylisocitrate lyase-like PEP mutase family enzyme
MPGAFNAMSARVVEDLDLGAVYLTGAGVTNMSFGLLDLGFVVLSDMAEHVSRIRDAVDLPMLVDADTGFGNALNVRHAVRTLERARADAIQLEDQVMPKRCGHFSGKDVIATAEMVSKIRAAADAREEKHFQIVARTDAAAVHGVDDAIERGHRFLEAGADILFIEAMEAISDVERLPALFEAPLLINIVRWEDPGSEPRNTRAARIRPSALCECPVAGCRARHAAGARSIAIGGPARRGSGDRRSLRRAPAARQEADVRQAR